MSAILSHVTPIDLPALLLSAAVGFALGAAATLAWAQRRR